MVAHCKTPGESNQKHERDKHFAVVDVVFRQGAHEDRNSRRDGPGREVPFERFLRGEMAAYPEEHFDEGDPENHEWYETDETSSGKDLEINVVRIDRCTERPSSIRSASSV